MSITFSLNSDWKIMKYGCRSDQICDPTQVNEAGAVRGPNYDFAVNVFYRNQKSFWYKNHFITIFDSKDI